MAAVEGMLSSMKVRLSSTVKDAGAQGPAESNMNAPEAFNPLGPDHSHSDSENSLMSCGDTTEQNVVDTEMSPHTWWHWRRNGALQWPCLMPKRGRWMTGMETRFVAALIGCFPRPLSRTVKLYLARLQSLKAGSTHNELFIARIGSVLSPLQL